MALRTDYKDYIPPTDGRKYQITANPDGSSKIVDTTQYQQDGDTWGAGDANAFAAEINDKEPAFSILPVSKGGTGQSSLADVTVGNASRLGGKASGLFLADAGTVSGDLVQWAMAQTANSVFSTGSGTTNLPAPIAGGDTAQYYKGLLIGTSSSNMAVLLFSPRFVANSFWGAIQNSTFKGWYKLCTDQNTFSQVQLTQSQYDGLSSKDANTVYYIVG